MSSDHTIRVLLALNDAGADVAPDAAGPEQAVLGMLGAMEGQVRLDVTCLYVEDADLLAAARLPGLREVSLAGEESSLDPARLSMDMQRAAAAAEQHFQRTARQLARLHAHLDHRFQVARGRLAEELNRAAVDADLVVLSRALRATGLRPRTGRSFLDLLRQPGAVLLINEPWASGSAVVVLGDSQGAVDHAARLADLEGLSLVVALRRADGSPAVPQGARVRTLEDWDETAVAELCHAVNARLLVAPDATGMDWAGLLASLVDRLPCSVLKLPRRP